MLRLRPRITGNLQSLKYHKYIVYYVLTLRFPQVGMYMRVLPVKIMNRLELIDCGRLQVSSFCKFCAFELLPSIYNSGAKGCLHLPLQFRNTLFFLI